MKPKHNPRKRAQRDLFEPTDENWTESLWLQLDECRPALRGQVIVRLAEMARLAMEPQTSTDETREVSYDA